MSRPKNPVRGESQHAARLTESDVRRMRELHNEFGLCMRCISKIYDVKYTTARDAITFNSWKHVL